ncbi:hypothetical protein NC652_002013 [Populus alba x Populus x berolinensis]|nr:hypothetical protein NC652_002013 [Populus alba x Populus x berolinensis]
MGHHCMPRNNTRDHPGMIQVFSERKRAPPSPCMHILRKKT